MKNACSFSVRPEVSTIWTRLTNQIDKTFRFTPEEFDRFTNNKVARLIGELPFIAGCEDAERTALAHLAIYITAIRGGRAIFDHTKDDNSDPLARLRLGMSFKGGSPDIINHGMHLLALVMLEGYKRDQGKDRLSGEYNPLNDGSWDYEAMKEKITSVCLQNPCGKIDEIISMEDSILVIWT